MPADPRLFESRYDVAPAAHLLRMPATTLRAWVQGQRGFQPVLEPPAKGYLSFVNLTEAFVLRAMRHHCGIKMPRVREALAYVSRELGGDHPLAFRRFRTDYVDLFIENASGVAVNVSQGGQTRMHDMMEELDRIEWRGERPIALFPIAGVSGGDSRPIRISPLVAFGKPVLSGTRIPTRVVCDRFYGGESIRELAEDFNVEVEAIEEAVRAESEPIAA